MERTRLHRVRLLGELQVVSETGEPMPVPTDRVTQRLLVALALRAGQPRRADELVAVIWPGSRAFGRGPKNLEAPVSRLRNKVHMPIPPRRGKDFYQLDLARHEVDALDFVDSVKADHLPAGELGRLLSLWRGDPRTIYGEELLDREWAALNQAIALFTEHLQRLAPSAARELRPALDTLRELLPEAADTIRQPAPPQRQPRLLIVENELKVAKMIASILFDYQTIIAVTLDEAMQVVTEQLHDLDGALVDLHLTDHLDHAGFELLSYIRDRRPELPRILITASPPSGSQEQTRRKYGIVDLLVKGADGYSASGVRDAVRLMFDTSEEAVRRRAVARFESHAIGVQRALTLRTVAANRGIRSGERASYRDLERCVGELEAFERDIEQARRSLAQAPVTDIEGTVAAFTDRWPAVEQSDGVAV